MDKQKLGARAWGPELDENGARVWSVAVVAGQWPNVQPVGQVYKPRSFAKARQLAAKIATDRDIDLYLDAEIL